MRKLILSKLIQIAMVLVPCFTLLAQDNLKEEIQLNTLKGVSDLSNYKRLSFGDSTNSICIVNDVIVPYSMIAKILIEEKENFQMYVFENTGFFAGISKEEFAKKNKQIQWVLYLKTKQNE